MVKNLDWDKLGFSYIKTKSHIEYVYKNGKWSEGTLKSEDCIPINIAANVLHYGQAIFEGLKAFRGVDGKVRVFRDIENAKRLQSSAEYLCMPKIPIELFQEAIDRVVKDNIEYIPPYGTGGALYIRPFLFGSEPLMGVRPANEYIFGIYVSPVGAYYKGGIKPVPAIILDQFDRCAPRGSGRYKVAGNYANSLTPYKIAHEKGFPIVLFLDPREHRYIDEFSTSNFIAITKDNEYITPKSDTILPSITNNSLMKLAKDIGLKVIERPIEFDEIEKFKEVAASGTAVVITPISKIVRGNKVINFGESCGKTIKKLYDTIQDIQYGRKEDKYNWTRIIEE